MPQVAGVASRHFVLFLIAICSYINCPPACLMVSHQYMKGGENVPHCPQFTDKIFNWRLLIADIVCNFLLLKMKLRAKSGIIKKETKKYENEIKYNENAEDNMTRVTIR